jgi:small subunit ribosomal protein S19
MAKKRIFTYRGFSLDDIKKMRTEEFVNLLPSSRRRSLLRGVTEKQKKFMFKVSKAKSGEKVKLYTHCRDIIVTPDMLDLEIHVHNGKGFVRVKIIPEMLGHYIAEFAQTRGRVRHGMPGIGATKSSLYIPLK